jgi:four helix bundle protein
MTPKELQARTKAFALRVVTLVDTLPRSTAGQVIGRQLLRSATSAGANYRAACRAQSHAEFAAKLSLVVEEADESLYWLELLQESSLIKPMRLTDLLKEANELVAISVAARKTAKQGTANAGTRPRQQSSIDNSQTAIVNRQSKIDNP